MIVQGLNGLTPHGFPSERQTKLLLMLIDVFLLWSLPQVLEVVSLLTVSPTLGLILSVELSSSLLPRHRRLSNLPQT
jgi:hypothetical protein